MALTILPWYCDDASQRNRTILNDAWMDKLCIVNRTSQIMLFNKRRDQFSLLVGAGLKIIGINIDALGSFILRKLYIKIYSFSIASYPDSECLNTKKKCCNMTRDSQGNSLLLPGASKDCFRGEKMESEDCSATESSQFSFIKFDLNPKSLVSDPQNPPTLSLIVRKS